jgi:mxaK protein
MEWLTSLFKTPAVPWSLLAVLLAAAAYQGYTLQRDAEYNRLLAQPEQIQLDDDSPALLVFAKAHEMERSGNANEAQRLYSRIAHAGDDAFRAAVRYNLGTVYLREAAKIWNAVGVMEYVRVNTLVALAKENLRESLRLAPDNPNARFNLEYAYRITPPPKERDKADWRGSKSSVFSSLPAIPEGAP